DRIRGFHVTGVQTCALPICGDAQAFTIAPDACHTIADVLVDGVSAGAVGSYTFSNVTANHTIAASFTLNTYTIAASAGAGGSIRSEERRGGKEWRSWWAPDA